MRVTAEPLDLPLRHPFRISRGVQDRAHSLFVIVEADGVTGIGEAAPDSSGYYGEKVETMLAALHYLEARLPDDPLLREDALAGMDAALHHGHGALKSALDMALWDYAGKRAGMPVYRMLGLNPGHAPLTSLTIGIDTPDEMAQRAREAADFPILKIKVGTEQDVERVCAIRDVTDAT